MHPDTVLSAQVVLASASGARPTPRTRITSENIREWIPSADAIAHVQRELREMGFQVGPCIGNSMSITGAARLFESRFHTTLREAGGAVQFAKDGEELASQRVPTALRAHVAAVTFVPPPAFGPGTASSFN